MVVRASAPVESRRKALSLVFGGAWRRVFPLIRLHAGELTHARPDWRQPRTGAALLASAGKAVADEATDAAVARVEAAFAAERARSTKEALLEAQKLAAEKEAAAAAAKEFAERRKKENAEADGAHGGGASPKPR